MKTLFQVTLGGASGARYVAPMGSRRRPREQVPPAPVIRIERDSALASADGLRFLSEWLAEVGIEATSTQTTQGEADAA